MHTGKLESWSYEVFKYSSVSTQLSACDGRTFNRTDLPQQRRAVHNLLAYSERCIMRQTVAWRRWLVSHVRELWL